jgi:hypothetical protein
VGAKQWQNYPDWATAEKNKLTGSVTMPHNPTTDMDGVKRKISASYRN